MLIGLAAGLASGIVFGVAAVVQAHGVRGLDGATGSLIAFCRRAIADLVVLAVVAAYLVGFLLHAVAIWLLPLYLAQAAIAVSMPVTALCSAAALRERVTGRQWTAVAAVSAGIVLLATGAGHAGEPRASLGLVLPLVALLPTLLVVGWLLLGRRGLPAVIALGALAGLGYAGSALAVRGVSWPPTVAVTIAALAVPTLSLVAFWLYSAALDRTQVTPATAALIVVQTVVPAVIGLAWLGDAVRSWIAVALGLTLALGGALAAAPGAELSRPGGTPRRRARSPRSSTPR